jgi:glycerol uptake facilitator-like aquaporin
LLRPSSTFGWAKVIPFCVAQLAGAMLGSWINLFLYASKIREFEAANNIVRGAPNSIASAKAFGEYFE